MKFKHYINEKFSLIKDGIKANVVVFVYTVLLFFVIWSEIFELNIISNSEAWIFALSFGVLFSLCLTKFFEYIKKTKLSPTFINLVSTAVVCFAISLIFNYADEMGGSIEDYFYFAYFGCIIAVISLTLWFVYKVNDAEYVLPKIISSAVFAGSVATIVSNGILISIMAFNSMIVSLDNLFEHTSSAFSFCFIVIGINIFVSGFPATSNQNISKIFKFLVFYIAFPLYLILISILYLYLLIIIFSFDIPAGEINHYATIASLFFIFFNFTLESFKSNKIAAFFLKYGKFFILPIILMQLVAVVIRAFAYGVTSPFLISILTMIISITYVVLLFLKNKVCPTNIFAILSIATVLFSCTPLNVIDISAKSQIRRLNNIVETANGQFTDDQKDEIESIFDYLNYSGGKYGDEYLGKTNGEYISYDEKFFELFGYNQGYGNNDFSYSELQEYYVDNYITSIDITGFTTAYPEVSTLDSFLEVSSTENISIPLYSDGEIVGEVSFDELDTEVLTPAILEQRQTDSRYIDMFMEVDTLNGGRFYIQEINFDFNKDTEIFNIFHMNGILVV